MVLGLKGLSLWKHSDYRGVLEIKRKNSCRDRDVAWVDLDVTRDRPV